jgi:hypothetical protein
MIRSKFLKIYFCLFMGSIGLTSCVHRSTNNEGQLQSYPVPAVEAQWIREGQPIIINNDKFYPVNDVEILLDSEVYQVSEYKGVQIFVEKIDTKPYNRVYTKFGKNKFRFFEKR